MILDSNAIGERENRSDVGRLRWMQRERRGAKGLKIKVVGVGLVVVETGGGKGKDFLRRCTND